MIYKRYICEKKYLVVKIIISRSTLRLCGILFVSLFIDSCAHRDNGEIRNTGKIIPVPIDLVGISWQNGEKSNTEDISFEDTSVALKDKDTGSLVIDSQHKIIAVGAEHSIIAYIYLKYDRDDSNYVKELQNGDNFRIIVYNKSDGSYLTHRDYIVGQEYEQLRLESGMEYTVVSYTFGVNKLPAISDLEQKNINLASVQFDEEKIPLVAYQKQDFTPIEDSDGNAKNALSINLSGKSSSLSVMLRSLGSGSIIDDSRLSMYSGTSYDSAQMDLNEGKLSCISGCNRERRFTTNMGKGIQVSTNNSMFIFTDRKSVSLDVAFEMFGSYEYLDKISFYMYPGKKATVYVDLRVCGAYLGANNTNFKRFMCNDLGGEIINPNQRVMRREQNGKWGFDWSKEDKKNRFVRINHFIGTCPEGWHVPNVKEWKDVHSNNSMKNLFESKDNFTYGIKIGENIVLPMSGYISSRGDVYPPSVSSYAYRWVKDYNYGKDDNDLVAYLAMFRQGGIYSGVSDRESIYMAHTVRCMKD